MEISLSIFSSLLLIRVAYLLRAKKDIFVDCSLEARSGLFACKLKIHIFQFTNLVTYGAIKLEITIAIVGIIVAGGVALFGVFFPSLKKRWNNPKLKIEFKNEEPFCRITTLEDGRQARWIRLRVKNIGRSIARGCEGKLVRITDAKTKEDRSDFDSVVLRWVNTQSYEPIDINKSEYEYLDLVYRTSIDDRNVRIAADEKLRRGINLYPPLKDYILRVAIFGKNVNSVEKSYYYKGTFTYFKDQLSEYQE